jgi:lysophospholipase L1-like esterase
VKKFFLLLVVLVCAAGAWWLFSSSPAGGDYRNLPPRASGDWIAFGDSLTAGYGAEEGGSYPEQLSKILGRKIVNAGRSGDTTADGLGRMEEVAAAKPAVVLLCFGGNDSLRRRSREETFANLAAIIDRLHAEGTFVVLIGIQSADLIRDKYSADFKKLAREKQVFYIPNILKGVIGTSSLMSDYVHPNEAGYAVIAERIAGELQDLLPKLQR